MTNYLIVIEIFQDFADYIIWMVTANFYGLRNLKLKVEVNE